MYESLHFNNIVIVSRQIHCGGVQRQNYIQNYNNSVSLSNTYALNRVCVLYNVFASETGWNFCMCNPSVSVIHQSIKIMSLDLNLKQLVTDARQFGISNNHAILATHLWWTLQATNQSSNRKTSTRGVMSVQIQTLTCFRKLVIVFCISETKSWKSLIEGSSLFLVTVTFTRLSTESSTGLQRQI